MISRTTRSCAQRRDAGLDNTTARSRIKRKPAVTPAAMHSVRLTEWFCHHIDIIIAPGTAGLLYGDTVYAMRRHRQAKTCRAVLF